MPKIFSEDEKRAVLDMHREGLSNVEIAKRMAARFPDHWDNKSGHRAAARIIASEDIAEGAASIVLDTEKTLDEMTREERYRFIEERLKDTPRFRATFRNFNEDDKELFTDEYLGILKSIDTLTEAEEQMLFTSVLEFVLGIQSLNRKQVEENLFQRSVTGEISQDDPLFRRFMDDKYQKEYDQHMKLYQKGMSELKMSRRERLDKVKTERRTLIDVAEDLSSKSAQADAANAIEELSRKRDEELKIMLNNGYLHGVFLD